MARRADPLEGLDEPGAIVVPLFRPAHRRLSSLVAMTTYLLVVVAVVAGVVVAFVTDRPGWAQVVACVAAGLLGPLSLRASYLSWHVAVAPGGRLLLLHDRVVVDDPGVLQRPWWLLRDTVADVTAGDPQLVRARPGLPRDVGISPILSDLDVRISFREPLEVPEPLEQRGLARLAVPPPPERSVRATACWLRLADPADIIELRAWLHRSRPPSAAEPAS